MSLEDLVSQIDREMRENPNLRPAELLRKIKRSASMDEIRQPPPKSPSIRRSLSTGAFDNEIRMIDSLIDYDVSTIYAQLQQARQGGECAGKEKKECQPPSCAWDKEEKECYDADAALPSLLKESKVQECSDERTPERCSLHAHCEWAGDKCREIRALPPDFKLKTPQPLQRECHNQKSPDKCETFTQKDGSKCEWAGDECREIRELPPGFELKMPKIKAQPRSRCFKAVWPSRDEPFEVFTVKLFEAFTQGCGLNLNDLDRDAGRFCGSEEQPDQFAIAARGRETAENPQGWYAVNEPAIQQKMAMMLISPDTPYQGVVLDHNVGTGKTRVGLGILGNFIKTGARLIWVTTTRAKISVRTQRNDFAFFDGTGKDPFFAGASARSHTPGKIALFSYEEFVNSLGGGSQKNQYYGVLQKWAAQHKGDRFANTVVVIDEAHKIFEGTTGAGNGAAKGQYVIERAAYESYDHNRDNHRNACRWVFLTATPMPTIDIPTDGRSQVTTAGGPQAHVSFAEHVDS